MCVNNVSIEAFNVTCSNNSLPIYEPITPTCYIEVENEVNIRYEHLI